MQATGQTSAVSAIRQALDAYLRQTRKKKVLALRGQVLIEDNWRELRALEVAPNGYAVRNDGNGRPASKTK